MQVVVAQRVGGVDERHLARPGACRSAARIAPETGPRGSGSTGPAGGRSVAGAVSRSGEPGTRGECPAAGPAQTRTRLEAVAAGYRDSHRRREAS